MPRLRSPRARRGRALLRIAALSLALLTLTGCSTTQIIDVGQPSETAEPELTRYQASFLDLFDTLTTVVGYAESEEEFRAVAEQLRSGLEEYHQLYDIYDEYEGINNIKTINDTAGGEPVEVDEKIIDLSLRDLMAHRSIRDIGSVGIRDLLQIHIHLFFRLVFRQILIQAQTGTYTVPVRPDMSADRDRGGIFNYLLQHHSHLLLSSYPSSLLQSSLTC